MWKEKLLTLLLFTSCVHSYVQVRSEDEVQCTKAGYFTHPTDCTRFYRCVDYFGTGVKFTAFHFNCPLGTIFDESISVCNHPAWVHPPPACLGQLPAENSNSGAIPPESSAATGGVVTPAPTAASEEGPAPAPAPEEAPVPAPEEAIAPAPETEQPPAPEEGPEEVLAPAPAPEEGPEEVPAPPPAPEEVLTPAPEEVLAPAPETEQPSVPVPEEGPEEALIPEPEQPLAPVATGAPEESVEPSEQETGPQSPGEGTNPSENAVLQPEVETEETTPLEPEVEATPAPIEEELVQGPGSEVAAPEEPEEPFEQPDEEAGKPSLVPEEERIPELEAPINSTAVNGGQVPPAAGTTAPTFPTFFLTCGGKEYYRHPMLCNRFYQCLWDGATISVVMFACGEGLVFDEPTKQCTAPEETSPCQELTTTTSASVLVKPEGTTNENKTYTVSEDTLYQCPHPGHFPYELDCLRFYRCFEVTPGVLKGLLYRCPSGYSYSAETERCQKQGDLNICDKTQNFYSRVPIPQISLEQTVAVRVEDLDRFFGNPNFFYAPGSL